MRKLNDAGEKLMKLEINKSWIYLLYIFLALPLVLFVLAWALRDSSMGATFGVLLHNYGLFVASPIPNFTSLTGIVGLVISAWLLFAAARKRDWADFGISAVLVLANALYYFFEVNYLLLRWIRLT